MQGGPGSGLSQELGCRAHEKPAACGAGDRGPEVTRPGCCWLQRGRGIGAWCWGPARAPGFLPHDAEWKRRRALWRAARERQIKGKADSEEGAPRSSQGVQVERAKLGPRTSPLSLQMPRRLPRTLVRQEHHSSSRPQTAQLQWALLRRTTTKASTWPALQVEPGSLGMTILRLHPNPLDCQAVLA